MKNILFPIMLLGLLINNTVNAQDSLTLTSPVIQEDGKLPLKYTCDGDGISPPLHWSGIPKDAKSLALIMDHLPQAKPKPQTTNDHQKQDKAKAPSNELRYYWSMYNVPANATDINEGKSIGILGSNIVNDKNEYAPPCSKGPGVKQYTIHLYALSDTLKIESSKKVTASVLRENMKGLVLESASLNFNFERSGATKQDRPKQENPGDNKRPPKKPDVQLKVPTLSESIESEACTRVKNSVTKAGFKDVTVTCDKTYAYVQSDTYPDHSLMNGITGTNEQIPVPALNYAAPILLHPELSETKTSIDAALGVAINGVPIYDYSAQGEIDLHGYDASKDTLVLGQLDECGGHAGRGDDYHYHAKPTCMIDSIKDFTDATIIGWGYDGFPLYADNNPDGSTITKGDLDVCNGQSDEKFGYRYHTSVEAPYIIQCLVGKVDTSILPRVAPLAGATARADLRPPREGVENLKHTQSEDGTRTLKYSYKGEEYYTRFKPSETKANCYDFEQKTISNNGAVESGTYCR